MEIEFTMGQKTYKDRRGMPALKCPKCHSNYIFLESVEKEGIEEWDNNPFVGIYFECWSCGQRFNICFGCKSLAVFPYISLLPDKDETGADNLSDKLRGRKLSLVKSAPFRSGR